MKGSGNGSSLRDLNIQSNFARNLSPVLFTGLYGAPNWLSECCVVLSIELPLALELMVLWAIRNGSIRYICFKRVVTRVENEYVYSLIAIDESLGGGTGGTVGNGGGGGGWFGLEWILGGGFGAWLPLEFEFIEDVEAMMVGKYVLECFAVFLTLSGWLDACWTQSVGISIEQPDSSATRQ